MYANNRASREAGRATFRTAGGSIYTFAHPFLAGQVEAISTGITTSASVSSDNMGFGEISISNVLKLDDTFFNATPAMDNAVMDFMVDGSTITITNHLMAGRAVLNVLPGSGLVRDGDLIAVAAFIASAKDNVGGLLFHRIFTSAGALTRCYYGVSFANFPHAIHAGNSAPTHAITMLYGGWFEGITSGDETRRALWAVGNNHGWEGIYNPFTVTGLGRVDSMASQDFAAGSFDSLELNDPNRAIPDGTTADGIDAVRLTPPAAGA
jgi:hypothetical protein